MITNEDELIREVLSILQDSASPLSSWQIQHRLKQLNKSDEIGMHRYRRPLTNAKMLGGVLGRSGLFLRFYLNKDVIYWGLPDKDYSEHIKGRRLHGKTWRNNGSDEIEDIRSKYSA